MTDPNSRIEKPLPWWSWHRYGFWIGWWTMVTMFVISVFIDQTEIIRRCIIFIMMVFTTILLFKGKIR